LARKIEVHSCTRERAQTIDQLAEVRQFKGILNLLSLGFEFF
jgi:hypothetical protein